MIPRTLEALLAEMLKTFPGEEERLRSYIQQRLFNTPPNKKLVTISLKSFAGWLTSYRKLTGRSSEVKHSRPGQNRNIRRKPEIYGEGK